MFKTLLAIFLAITGCANEPMNNASQPTATAPLPEPTVVLDYIIKVYCSNSTVGAYGTAFYIGNGRFATAQHVIDKMTTCVEARTGTALVPITIQSHADFAIIAVKDTTGFSSEGMKIRCDGFKTGETYHSFGYAGGKAFLMNDFVATSKYTTKDTIVQEVVRAGARELDGLLIPGMSGGPITNQKGEVVGINNITGNSGKKAWSYELSNTTLCPQGK